MNSIFKKPILMALTAALVLAAFPMTNAFAADPPPPVKGEITNEKLEQLWARQLKNYEKIGKGFEDTDAQIEKFQERIDKASEKGKDVTALQAALDAFESALTSGKPIYDSITVIVNTHEGFDASGKVTDAEQAKTTMKEMRTKMQELKSAMNGTGKALRDALKAFREANRPDKTETTP